MNYAVLHVSKGNFLVSSEAGEDLSKAKVQFHNLCSALENDKGDIDSIVKLVDENLDTVEGKYVERIVHGAKNEG